MCRCRDTYGAPPSPFLSHLQCSVILQEWSRSFDRLLSKPSVLGDQLMTGVVCLWIQVTWKCGSEVVSMQLSHRTRCSTRAVIARAHESWYRQWLKTIITFNGSERSLCERLQTVREMATAEQMQESLQQLQAQAARIASLETQLQIESARGQTAVPERSALIQTLVTIRGW